MLITIWLFLAALVNPIASFRLTQRRGRAAATQPNSPRATVLPALHHSPAVVDISPATGIRRMVSITRKPINRQSTEFVGWNTFNNLVGVSLVVPALIQIWIKLFWKVHVNIAQNFGVVPANFFTATCNVVLVTFISRGLTMAASKYQNTRCDRENLTAPSSSDVFSTLANIVINAVTVSLFTSRKAHFDPKLQLSFGMVAMYAAGFGLLSDITFFLLHRAMHQPKSSNAVLRYLSKIHRFHHRQDSIPDDLGMKQALGLHPVEFVLNISTTLVGPLILAAHPALHFGYHFGAMGVAWIFHSPPC